MKYRCVPHIRATKRNEAGEQRKARGWGRRWEESVWGRANVCQPKIKLYMFTANTCPFYALDLCTRHMREFIVLFEKTINNYIKKIVTRTIRIRLIWIETTNGICWLILKFSVVFRFSFGKIESDAYFSIWVNTIIRDDSQRAGKSANYNDVATISIIIHLNAYFDYSLEYKQS